MHEFPEKWSLNVSGETVVVNLRKFITCAVVVSNNSMKTLTTQKFQLIIWSELIMFNSGYDLVRFASCLLFCPFSC